MADGHNHPLSAPGTSLHLRAEPLDGQGVVTTALQGIFHPPEYAPAIMLDLRGLPVQRPGVRDGPPIGQVHGLVAQTHPQDRRFWVAENDLQAAAYIPGLGRMTGPR